MENKAKFQITKNSEGMLSQVHGQTVKGGIPGKLIVRADREGLHIFLFWIPKDVEPNVRAYDDHGNLLWIIETAWIGLDESRRINPYIGFRWDEEANQLLIGTFSGSYFELNPDTGKVRYIGTTY